ncbi:MAG: PDR/VanB family oxidoreductase [Actinomycetales bacterium]
MTAGSRHAVRVREAQNVAVGVKSLEFELVDGGRLPAAIAGQFINVVLDEGLTRSYSLINPTSRAPRSYSIAVGLAENSRGGSLRVHEVIEAGHTLTISGPDGKFVLADPTAHSVFIAGGIGITPIYAMIRELDAAGGSWELHYAVRSRDRAAFLPELASFDQDDSKVHLYVDDEVGPLTLPINDIVNGAAQTTHLYCCGPAPMIDAFLSAGRSRPSSTVHTERFTSEVEGATGGFTIELAKSGMALQVPENASILDVVLDAGIDIEFSCEEGICGSCRTEVLHGQPDHRDAILTEAERDAGDTMFICCSGSKGGCLVLNL